MSRGPSPSQRVPTLKTDSVGPGWVSPPAEAVYGFEQVYVATAADGAAAINAKLQAGLHVVLSPGIYQLDAPLRLGHPNQVPPPPDFL